MRKAVIILLIIVFSFSTVGMYIAAGGSPAPRRQSDIRSAQDTQNSDLPEYLQTGNPNVRGNVNATGQSEVTVRIGNNHFNPTVLRVTRGTVVTWRNQGETGHTITSDRGSPRSGLDSNKLRTGGTYQHTFDEPGVYNYYSQSSPTAMRGVVKVKR